MNNIRADRVAAPLRIEVTDALREAIVTAEFSPGERLVEAALCQKFQVSRTVIREALRQLETEKLVVVVPNRGPAVAALSLHEAECLYEIRRSLEALAGSLFAERATDPDCAGLVAALNEVKSAMKGDDVLQKLAAKNNFRKVLIAGAGNEEIGKMLREVAARTQALRMYSLALPSRGPGIVAELSRITSAAAMTRDPEEARAACDHHARMATESTLGEMRRRMRESADSPM
ncbi:GntR family transcriptional regulator [Paenarthrobacter sp. YAF11_1]|uniref:GntR family transcriptional regulator n=1 Tax=Paenarthrobacter sp. YAF11_1 TaxID=3233074 RepID=UPI003F97FF9D